MRTNNLILTLASISYMVTGLVSCDKPAPVETYTKEKILVVGNSNEPSGLDPHIVTGVLESNIIRSLFEGLCVQDPSGKGEHFQGAAKSWKSNKTFTEWTFELQDNGKWSDGEPVTAEDFAFAYKRILHPDFGAKYASMLYCIDGAEAYNKKAIGQLMFQRNKVDGMAWETIKDLPFQPDSEIKEEIFDDKEFADLDSNLKKKWILFKGIDYLKLESLKEIEKDLTLVEWPKSFTLEQKEKLIAKVIAFHSEKLDPWALAKVGISTPGKLTLKVKLNSSVPYLPDLTKHYTWFPVPKHQILAFGKMTDKYSKWTDPENLVGNGAFKITTWKFNDKIEVIRNPHYWDKDTVKLNGIRFLPISNTFTEARMFFNRQLHASYSVAPQLIEYADENYKSNLRRETKLGTNFIRFNMTRKKLDDIRVRQALAMAVNKELFIKNVIKGGETPATGIVPPMNGYTLPNIVHYNEDKAKELLGAAGYNKDNKLKIKLLTTDKDSAKMMSEALQAMWQKKLPVEVSITQREWKSYLQLLQDLDYDLATGGWIGDYPDPTTFLDMWKKGDGNNRTGWSSKKYEELLKKAGQGLAPPERMQTLQQAEKLFLEDYPIIPLYHYNSIYLLDDSVKNWNPLLLKNQPYKFLDLKN